MQARGGHFDWLFNMLLGMIFRLYSESFVEIHALFLEILRFEFVTLFVKHPVYLRNGWTDCADIWHVGSDQLVMWLQHAHRVSLCT